MRRARARKLLNLRSFNAFFQFGPALPALSLPPRGLRLPQRESVVPPHPRQNDFGADALSSLLDASQHAVDEDVGKSVRFEAEIQQCLVPRIIVMGFRLDPGILEVLQFDAQTEFFALPFHKFRQFQDAEDFRKLVKDAILTHCRRIKQRQLHAAQGVPDIEETAFLFPLAIYGERNASHSLNAEPIERRAEDFVIVKTGNQLRMENCFVGFDAVNHALVQVCRAQFPDSTGEENIMAVMNFGKVIKRPRLFREGKHISSALVLDLNKTFLDVDVGRAIFTHGPQLYQMALWSVLAHGPQYVERAGNVIGLSEYGATLIHHGKRRRRLLTIMDNGFRPEIAENFLCF